VSASLRPVFSAKWQDTRRMSRCVESTRVMSNSCPSCFHRGLVRTDSLRERTPFRPLNANRSSHLRASTRFSPPSSIAPSAANCRTALVSPRGELTLEKLRATRRKFLTAFRRALHSCPNHPDRHPPDRRRCRSTGDRARHRVHSWTAQKFGLQRHRRIAETAMLKLGVCRHHPHRPQKSRTLT
jgi:hypothetical protein